MWRRCLFIIPAMLFFAAVTPVSPSPPPELKLSESAAGQTFFLPRGTRLTIQLSGNPTTGYLWEVTPFPDVSLTQIDRAFEACPAPTAKVGAGGRFTFRFLAVNPGATRLEFRYQRPWEKNVPPAKIFYVDLEVR